METILTSSGLTVCYQGASYEAVDRALKRRDLRLLLDKESDDWGREVWVVRVRAGDNPADWYTPVYWKDPDGSPRELSMGIVDQLDAQEIKTRHDVVNGTRLADSAVKVRERLLEESRQAGEDLYREHEQRMKPGHGISVTIPTPLSEKGG